MTGIAFTREVSPKLPECALTHLPRTPIDAAAASLQHRTYEQALRDGGLEVVRLAALPDHPDGVFVEDTAILLDSHAIITRPGASSRSAEAASTAEGLAGHFEIVGLEDGTVDGGDVLRIGTKLFVGLSTRTNRRGAEALRNAAGRLGFTVMPVEVRHCLHLKTAATFAGRDGNGLDVLLHDPASIPADQFADVEAMAVHPDERAAANVLRLHDRIIMPASYPFTARALKERGYAVVEVDVSELEKAEAGVTCMSLVSEGE